MRTRQAVPFSSRNSEAETTASVSPSASFARTSSARPDVRTPASSRSTARPVSGVNASVSCQGRVCAASLAISRLAVGLLSSTRWPAAIDDQYGVGRHLKQQPVARFDVADAGVVALHRLLGVDQPPLQAGDGAQVAAERDDPLRRSGRDRRIQDRNVGAGNPERRIGRAGRRVVQVPPARVGAGQGLGQHLLDFRPAFLGNHVGPALAGPGRT